jgi:hypothetical protein
LGHALILPKETLSNKNSIRDHSQLSKYANGVEAVNGSGKSGTAARPTIICGEDPGSSATRGSTEADNPARPTERGHRKVETASAKGEAQLRVTVASINP